MKRSVLGTLAVLSFATSGVAQAQTVTEQALAASDELIFANEYEQSRQIVIQALGMNPSQEDRYALLDQLDAINDAQPFRISLDANSTFTTGARQPINTDKLSWTGVPHYTDETGKLVSAVPMLITTVEIGAAYDFELSPDLALTFGLESEFNHYGDVGFMETWIVEGYSELDLSLGPVLSNTRLSAAASSKSREKVDFSPNVPRVPGAQHFGIEQDLGFKLSKDQVLGAEFTFRMGDETSNVQFPGTKYEHMTLEGYYDASFGRSMDVRLSGYGQGMAADPAFTGFLAYGGGIEMSLDLPASFTLSADFNYRSQNGFAPYPTKTADLDFQRMAGEIRLSNDHYSLRGIRPYLSAGFDETTASYSEYTESNLTMGAGLSLGF